MQKKKWGKPKLIILARVKPNEMVLAVCKTNGNDHLVENINGGVNNCCTAICTMCHDYGSS